MRKLKILNLFFLMILLCSCSNSNNCINEMIDGTFNVDSTFQNISKETDNFNSEIYNFGFSYNNYIITNGEKIYDNCDNKNIYDGGEIKICFDRYTYGNVTPLDEGFIAYLGGVPQLLSLNGNEKDEMVSSFQEPEIKETVTLTFKPRITKDLIHEGTLQLKLLSIMQPTYKPNKEDNYVSFVGSHNGVLLFDLEIEMLTLPDIIENGNALAKYESILITTNEKTKYNIYDSQITNVVLFSTDESERFLYHFSNNENSIQMDLIVYGEDNLDYRIYFYKNHKRIKFNGNYDYLEIKNLQKDYLNKLGVVFDNVQNRDEIYAVAIPINNLEEQGTIIKTISCLILSENDPAYQNYLKTKNN